ncbi:MAG: RsmB/NOP family class I SAM-dependent RNA methyltransferase [Oculatellaceae cyanobacterium Prado106]|jgi:16S rRNA C967 or C1407 C5-methylase (RsmB/RsmF family)|nr:RsmB/NOP family class I SAM-dependent RNA methyltransferase [Oculatellaceae cyanobacterium Prado106]
MPEASKLLLKLSQKLFEETAEQSQFVAALTQPKPFHPCILWTQSKPESIPFTLEATVPWQPMFVDRLALGEKPGKNPLHDQGEFYCLDFSSVFAASPLLQLESASVILDVCASPGGKSLFAGRWFSLKEPAPQFLISNEAIGKRIGALISNLKRCRCAIAPSTQVITLNRDPSVLAELLPQTADVVLVDAPCSGQSLLAKGIKADGCFHPVSINKNANRQKRILANAAQLVAPQGHLLYMTCAYSPEENEQVGEWFLSRFPEFQPLAVPHLAAYQSHLSDRPCYRMFPQSRLGAGAFTMLFQNTTPGQRSELSLPTLGRGEGGVGSREWGVGSGEWGVGSGEWGVGSGEWGVGSGE